jgi:hypothetical protein
LVNPFRPALIFQNIFYLNYFYLIVHVVELIQFMIIVFFKILGQSKLSPSKVDKVKKAMNLTLSVDDIKFKKKRN